MPATKLYHVLHVLREKGWFAGLSPRALRVLLVLLDYYNWGKGRAWPSYATLCRDTGLSRSSVREALKELEFYGLWRVDRTRPWEICPKRVNIYRLPEVVPDMPQQKYHPGAAWSRPERLDVLTAGRKGERAPNGDRSRALNSDRSRALNPNQSRAPVKDRFSALGGNYVVNYAVEQRTELRREGAGDFHSQTRSSPDGEEPPRELTIKRHLDYWRSNGGGEKLLPGVRRSLAAALRVDEDVAEDLLRHGPQ